MNRNSKSDWPSLTTYDQDHLRRIALPLGGIGAGTVSLGGRGNLRDWEIMNRPAKGFTPATGFAGTAPFFTLFAQIGCGRAVTRVLEGPIDTEDYESGFGCRGANHGLPRFRKCTFGAAYPFGQVSLSDPAVPLDVQNEAECGHHYARAMASWAAVLALTGFRYSGVEKSMTFAGKNGAWFWSNGSAWGTCTVRRVKRHAKVDLRILHGRVTLARFVLDKIGAKKFPLPKTICAGERLRISI